MSDMSATFEVEGKKATVRFSAQAVEVALTTLSAKVDGIVQTLKRMEDGNMATFEEIITELQNTKAGVQSLNTLMDSMRQKISDLLAGEIVPPNLQAKIDAIFLEAKGVSAEIQVALDENPVEPVEPPPVEPPVEGEV